MQLKSDESSIARLAAQHHKEQLKQAEEQAKRAELRTNAIIAIVCIVIAAGIVIAKLAADNKELRADNKAQESRIEYLEDELDKTSSTLATIRPEFDFFYKNAVIVTARAGEKYHHYGCHYVSNRDYFIYNIKLAKSLGYEPCSYCYD